MTVRGGGVPRKPWLSCRCAEWARRLGASLPMRKTASWSGSLRPTEYKVAARLFVRHKRAPLDIVIPTTTSALPCSMLSRCGLASPRHEEISERRPTLTASARDSVWTLWVGAKKRAFKSNKETETKKTCRELPLDFQGPIQGFSDAGVTGYLRARVPASEKRQGI